LINRGADSVGDENAMLGSGVSFFPIEVAIVLLIAASAVRDARSFEFRRGLL
jgi:hypothetical protein